MIYLCATQLAVEANRLDFAYYLVATSTVTPDRSSDHGWLKQFTSHPAMAVWVNKKSNLLDVFGLYTKGNSMIKAVELANEEPKKRKRLTKTQKSDVVKVQLGRALCALTSKFVFLVMLLFFIDIILLASQNFRISSNSVIPPDR